MKNPFGRSLAGKLRLSSLAVVVPLLILAGIIVYQTWAVRPQEALRDSLELAVEGSHQMDDFLVRTGKVLVALAHVPEIEDIKADEATSMLQNLSRHFPERIPFFCFNLTIFITKISVRILTSRFV